MKLSAILAIAVALAPLSCSESIEGREDRGRAREPPAGRALPARAGTRDVSVPRRARGTRPRADSNRRERGACATAHAAAVRSSFREPLPLREPRRRFQSRRRHHPFDLRPARGTSRRPKQHGREPEVWILSGDDPTRSPARHAAGGDSAVHGAAEAHRKGAGTEPAEHGRAPLLPGTRPRVRLLARNAEAHSRRHSRREGSERRSRRARPTPVLPRGRRSRRRGRAARRRLAFSGTGREKTAPAGDAGATRPREPEPR